MPCSKKILILGCGYLGKQLVKDALKQGYSVDALSRNPDTCATLSEMGVTCVLPYELDDHHWHSLIHPNDYDAVILCVGSAESTQAGYQKSYLKGSESTVTWARDFEGKLLYTSSVSVYGDHRGAWVDENTLSSPENWRGRIILESESILTRALASQACIFRLGGLYGPDRNRFLQAGGHRDPETSTDYDLNLIHVEDASSALRKYIEHPPTQSRLFNLTDNHPVRRSELDRFIQSRFPDLKEEKKSSFSTDRRRNPANRRIRSSLIQSETGWTPKYPLVFDAIAQLV
jgi:nucleoside-diphosphate-sugar epimerase